MPKPDKPLKTAFTPLRAKLVDLPPPPPKLPAPPAPLSAQAAPPATPAPAPAATNPAQQPDPTAAKTKEAKPLPPAVELQLELVSRADREVHGWCYSSGRSSERPTITLVLNGLHPEVAAALNAKDHARLARLVGLAWAEGLWIQHWKPTWRALQATLRAELLPPEKQNVTGMLFLAETLARHPLVQAVAQRACNEPPPSDGRLPMGSIPLS
jgi:hypothetical protein